MHLTEVGNNKRVLQQKIRIWELTQLMGHLSTILQSKRTTNQANGIILKENGIVIKNEEKIADLFNSYYVNNVDVMSQQ